MRSWSLAAKLVPSLLGAAGAGAAWWFGAAVPPETAVEIRDVAWIVVLVVLWSVGLGLILTALLRERDREAGERAGAESDDGLSTDEGEGGDERGDELPPGRRWLH